jgi:cytochrome c-type biogenesis protein CcmF
MAELGHFALVLGLFLAGYAVCVDVLGAWHKERGLILSGRNATIACWLCLSIATVALLTLLIRHDFSVTYVAEHTSRELPLEYTISAFWAGAAGSLLLWLWLQAGFVALVFCKSEPDQRTFAACARAAANLVGLFFLLVLILDKNPFALSAVTPSNGAGLNPLLQHPAMALHPPTLFVGYAAFIIPFAWAFASLRRNSEPGAPPFFRQVRNWTLWAWLFLTIGIALGAWWAYEELGWGGYWAWDPVENSSLMPWLIATALLHCSRTYHPRTSIAVWLMVLSIVTFSLCIFGTFLTRYGLVSSVHAFPEPGLGILFLVLLVVIWLVAAVLLWRKFRSRTVEPQEEGPLLRRYIVFNNWIMILLTFVIFLGTLFPFFSGLLAEQKITLKSDYFTKITAVPGLAVLFLLAACPYLLRHGIGRNWRIVGGGLAAAVAFGGWLLTRSLAVPCFVICGFAAVNLAADFFGGKLRIANSSAETKERPRTLRWYGARIAHFSVVLIFFGIAGSGAYEIEKKAALNRGQSIDVGRFSIKYDELKADHGPNFTAVTAEVTVSRDNQPVASLSPSQAYYRQSDKRTSEVDIRRTLAGDLYVAVTGVDSSTGLVNLRVLVKPLINWIWIGSTGLVLGACLVLVSFYKRSRMVRREDG